MVVVSVKLVRFSVFGSTRQLLLRPRNFFGYVGTGDAIVTERLYYSNSYELDFDTTVTAVEVLEGRVIAVLDRTLFYPTSGGQPNDTGVLEGLNVSDVEEREDGTVGHFVEGNILAGQPVHGRINWLRRFDHMQQHTGQHLLSAAFDRLHKARTVSFHLGEFSSTIDLAYNLESESIADAETEANRIVWEDRVVKIRSVEASDAAKLPLRKESLRSGVVRLIEIEDFDLSACGGTHVARTGGVGVIAVKSCERFKGGIRVEFVCGGRVLDMVRVAQGALTRSVRLLSVLPEELPEAIGRLQENHRLLKKHVSSLEKQLALKEASTLVSHGIKFGQMMCVVDAVEGYDASGLKKLATAITINPGYVVVLSSMASPIDLVVARSDDVALDASLLLRQLLSRFGGRGGGRPRFAQAGGLETDQSTLLRVVLEMLREFV